MVTFKLKERRSKMEKGRQIGEGSSLSWREQRNLREKERRMHMKHLFSLLSSHVSPTRKLPIPQLIDHATSYMIQLNEKVNRLKERKRTLLREDVGSSSERSSSLPKLSIRSYDSTIEMNLIMDQNMRTVMLHELVSVFIEEGAQVMNANLQNLNDKTTYTIIAQAITCWVEIDPSRIEEKIRQIIFP